MKSKYRKVILILVIILGGTIQSLLAQQLKGIIITDDGVMPGVVVSIVNQNKETVTDIDGSFFIVANEEEHCELKISVMGYFDKQVYVNVEKGLNDIGRIKLEADDTMLKEVVIKASLAATQSRAYSIKMNSSAIMDVVASDAMGKLPDKNIAESMQRIQGIGVSRFHGEADAVTVRGTPYSWTSVLVNGNRFPSSNINGERAIALESIPSDLVQYVQVSKAITPDMDGDAIGGSINFITRTAPFSRKLGGSLAGGYNYFSGKETYNGSLLYGDRFLKNKLGIVFVGTMWDRQMGSDTFETKYNTGSKEENERYAINNIVFKRYMGKRQTYGVNLGLEYEFNDDHKIYIRGLYDKLNDIRPSSETFVDYTKSRYQYNYRYSYYQTKLSGGELGGIHNLSNKTTFDWVFSNYTSNYFLDVPSTSDKKGLPIASFYQPIKGGFNNLSDNGLLYWGFDGGNAGYNPLKFVPGLKNSNEIIDPNKMVLNSLAIVQLDNKENDKTVQINIKNDVSDKLIVKGGLKFRSKFRNSTLGSFFFYGVEGDKLSDLQREEFKRGNGFFSKMKGNYNYNLFALDPLTETQLNLLYTSEYLNTHNYQDYTSADNATNIYEARENIYAGYIMGTYKPTEKLVLVGGIRNEFTTTKLRGTKVTTEKSDHVTVLSPLEANNDYNVFLPMLHLKYNIDESSNLRFAYTKTFNRANFSDMSPGTSINSTGAEILITKGNTDLKPTISNNFDLMYEHYFDNIGLLSGGVFYKRVKNVIFKDESQFNQNNTTYIITEAKNLENAKVVGFEVGINKRFDFLPDFWSGFGIEANYTFIDNIVNVPRQYRENGELVTVVDKSSLPNQSKHLGNIILFYERGKVMVRLAGNYRGKSINVINQSLGKNYYLWTDDNFTVDATATYTLNKKIKFFLELNNITNEPFKQYMGDKRRLTSYEWFGIRGQLGIRVDLF